VLYRALPAALVLVATVADSVSRPGLAFYALLAAVPFAAIAALSALGDVLDRSSRSRGDALGSLQTLLWTAALVLIVSATSARSGVLDGAPAASFGEPALVACIGALGLESLLAAFAHARRPVLVLADDAYRVEAPAGEREQRAA
jgi:hypothetical protein